MQISTVQETILPVCCYQIHQVFIRCWHREEFHQFRLHNSYWNTIEAISGPGHRFTIVVKQTEGGVHACKQGQCGVAIWSDHFRPWPLLTHEEAGHRTLLLHKHSGALTVGTCYSAYLSSWLHGDAHVGTAQHGWIITLPYGITTGYW